MPTTISHYRLDEEVGRGGMGVVYRAVDTKLGRAVAIKMLPAEMTSDEDRRRRFVQEARSASALNHPNIVTIHEIDTENGVTFIAMELVEGTPLDQVIAAGPLSIETALTYARQIAAALEVAHASGIVHRDIKPANIMVTRDGRIKVLDFGLAKLVERAPADATMSAVATRAGIVMGTAAYMSPEQAEGKPVDARSDVFSFGAVFYEMLAGQRAFSGTSDIGVITSILRDTPPHLRNVRADVPAVLSAIVDRCLAKKHASRYEHGGAVRKDLDAAAGATAQALEPIWRRPAVMIAGATVLIVMLGLLGWRTLEARKARDARVRVLPQIQELTRSPRSLEAMRLARQIETLAPDEVRQVRKGWPPLDVRTDPAGATIEFRNYLDLDGQWEPLGPSPIRDVPVPLAYYRFRITKAGYLPLEIGSANITPVLRLAETATAPTGMVRVNGGSSSYLAAVQVDLPDFWIDRDEVTNAQFKAFVDAGGYRDPKYWQSPFVENGRTLSFDEAMTKFRDATGRTGPATWETGSFPDGQADFPVGGISWFEASAYAAFAGKTLPTIYHWYRAAGVDGFSADILHVSNFDGKGPSRAGERAGVGPFGTRDMAGNVKEWCLNTTGEPLRYILGGGWNEPSYRYNEADAQNPWERRATFGVRLIKNLGPADAAERPLRSVEPDLAAIVPVGDAAFEAYKRSYSYDKLPLDARIDAVDDNSPEYRKETVSFAAAYGGERVPAYLFIPKNAKPPYQTILLFPSAYSRASPSSQNLDLSSFEFIVKSGRALLYPVYKDTFERRLPSEPSGPSAMRDRQVAWAKDVFRAVDYLETRPEIDAQRLGYYSLSMGAYFGPIPLALEPRLKTGVLVAGGLRFNYPPEIDPSNFMPRVKVPMLMVNGKDDYGASAAARQRFIELLGTPAEHKRSVELEGGHVPTDWRGAIREVLDWYDKYLGPVK